MLSVVRFYALLALAAGLLAIGCGDDRYKGIDKQPVLARDLRPPSAPPVGAGREAVFGTDPQPQSMEAALGADPLPSAGYSRTDLEAKGDIYWKLVWIDRSVNGREVPHDVPGLLDTLLLKVRGLTPDRNTRLMETILTDLTRGVDAHDADLRLRENGVDPDRLSWSAGRLTLEQELNDRNSQDSSDTPLSDPAHADSAANQITEWASQHHTPPAEVMQSAFRAAHAHTAELGDSLDAERSLAGAHPLGRDNVPGASSFH